MKQSIRSKQGNIVYSERYEYDKNGNRVFSEENGEIKDYWYDENNRLKKIRIGGEGGDYEIYEFDGFGNISTKVEIDGNYIGKTKYSYDNRNRLVYSTDGEESTAYEYDKNSNLKKKVDFYGVHSKSESYTYTAFGELKTAEGDNFFAEYFYGADGFRSGKKVNGVSTEYVYDGMYIVGESVDGVNYTYSRGTDLLGYTSSLGETVYYRTNVHGDVKELVNVFGESLERYEYNAYGAEGEDYNPFRRMFGKKSAHNPFRYTGEYTDSETGFVYLRNRMYDPETGRFISEDTHWNMENCIYGDSETNTPDITAIVQSSNLYVYCINNPVRYIDNCGENAEDILYGVAEAILENNLGGTIKWAADKILGNRSYSYENEYDYYTGRVIGDAVSALIGAGLTVGGAMEIIGSIALGGTITYGSGGILAVGGLSISTAGVAAGTATATVGATTVVLSVGNFGQDYSKMTGAESTEKAKKLGYQKTNKYSHGQPVYYNKKTKTYITPDVDRHNGGVWKMGKTVESLNSRTTRMGTYDANLKRIGD